MKFLAQRFVGSIRRMMRSEDGSSTIEFVLWLPILVSLITITADASLILGAKARVLRVVEDANRATAIGRFRTVAETQDYVKANIGTYAAQATVTSVFSGGVVSTTVVIPSKALMAVGFLGYLTGINVTVTAQHMLEA